MSAPIYAKAKELSAYIPVKDYDNDEDTNEDTNEETMIPIPSDLFKRIQSSLIYYENMAGEQFKAPTLANATPSFLVDELKEVRDRIKPMATYEKLLANLVKSQRPTETNRIVGERFVGDFKFIEKRIPDKEKIQTEMGLDWWDEHCKDSKYWQITLSKKD